MNSTEIDLACERNVGKKPWELTQHTVITAEINGSVFYAFFSPFLTKC